MQIENCIDSINSLRFDACLEELVLDIPLCQMAKERNKENLDFYLENGNLDEHKINEVFPFYIRAPKEYKNTPIAEIEVLLIKNKNTLMKSLESNSKNRAVILNPLFSKIGISCLKFNDYIFFMIELS